MKKIVRGLLVLGLVFSQLLVVQATEDDKYINKGGHHHIEYETEKSNYALRGRDVLPTTYDTRKDYMSSVKDQGSYGSCWAFGVTGAAETNLLKYGRTSENEPDLSEYQLAYFFYHPVNDPLGNSAGDRNVIVGDENFMDIGGNNYMALMSNSRWLGLVNEDKAKYTDVDNALATSSFLTSDLAYNNNSYVMKNGYLIADDIESLKKAVYINGSVTMAYHTPVDEEEYVNYYNEATHSYYDYDNKSENHTVLIVGYDDAYSKDNFNKKTKPKKDGAWIVKNSWGSEWGDNGYFYLSYDNAINTAVSYEYMPANTYDHNYFYDGSSGLLSLNIRGSDTLIGANIFEAKGETGSTGEVLEAVSVGIASVDTHYDVQIYKDLKDLEDPKSGTKVGESTTGNSTNAGIYTIELNDKVVLENGTNFSVVVTLKKDDGIPQLFSSSTVDYGWVRVEESNEAYQSFLGVDDELLDLKSRECSLRIKAFTKDEGQPSNTKAISNVSMSSIEDQVFSKEGIVPEIELVEGNYTLKKDIDYTLNYKYNDEVGDATMIVNGIGAYRGTKNILFNIIEKDIATLQIADIEAQLYTGEEIKPEIIIKDGINVLTEGEDYTISYSENKQVGRAKAEIQGINNYKGLITKYFDIKKAIATEDAPKDDAGLSNTNNPIDAGDHSQKYIYAGFLLVSGVILINYKRKASEK